MSRTGKDAPNRITLERVYRATLEDVWDLWTTKEGIESWWGPEGFAVTVRSIDVRPEGELHYAMSAVAPEMAAFMVKQGMPTTTEHHVTYTDVVRLRRLAYEHPVDFVPGVAAYDVTTVVELSLADAGVKMVLSFDRMHDDLWTQRAAKGWESEIGKLEKVLSSRARAATEGEK